MGERVSKLRSALVLASTLITAACGQNTDHQRFYGAVESLKNPGLIVSGLDKSSRDELMQTHPEAKYRILNTNLSIYELTGLTKQEVREVSKDALIEKNKILKFKSKKLEAKKRVMTQLKTSDSKSPFSECFIIPFLGFPEIQFEPLSTKSIDYLQVGDVIKLSSPTLSETEKIAWNITPPLGSGQESHYTEELEIKVKFSMASAYYVTLLYKKNDLCNYKTFTLNPTINIPLSDEIVMPKKSLENFYHLDVVNHVSPTDLKPIQKTLVAVCDTGVNYNHPALRQSIWTNSEEVADGIDNDGNGYIDDLYGYDFFYNDNMPSDDNGHGTHIAGLIVGFEMGVAYGLSEVMALKVGSSDSSDTGSIVECIYYATQKGADVINLSLIGSYSKIMEMVLENAKENGVLIVTGAGNGNSRRGIGSNNDISPLYPASYDLSNIITVASTDENGKLTEYSNFGEMSVDIAAPGGYKTENAPVAMQLLSAYLPNPEGIYLQPLSGTSMATPIVAGAAAMLLAKYPGTQPEKVIQILKETGTKSELLSGKIGSASVLNIHAALTTKKVLF